MQQEPPPHNVFADAAAMKLKVRETVGIVRFQYSPSDLYSDIGLPQRLVRHSCFEMAKQGVSFLFVVSTAMQADKFVGEALLYSLFLACYAILWCVQFAALENKINIFREAWMCMEFLLLICMAVLTFNNIGWLVVILFSSRMLQCFPRGARFPEISIILKGIAAAMRSVFPLVVMMLWIVILFGFAFHKLSAHTEVGEDYFSSLGHAINSLVMYGVLLSGTTNMAVELSHANVGLEVLFVVFVAIILMLLFITLSIVGEVLSTCSAVEKEKLLAGRCHWRVDVALQDLGICDGIVTQTACSALLQDTEVVRSLMEAGVDVIGLVDFKDFIFQDGDLSQSDFVSVVLSLRGSNTATVKDIIDFRKLLSSSAPDR